MCGRYKMTAEERAFLEKYGFLDAEEYFDIHGYSKRPEVFPGTNIMAINNAHHLENIWWTIRDRDAKGVMRSAINAKAENLMWAKMFKDAFLNDRVLIPATGLYEWQLQPDKSKIKFEIWFDEPIFSFAGIARNCEIKGEEKRCGVIITTVANAVFAEIHNTNQRQAVVIRENDYEKWLDPKTSQNELKGMLKPLPAEETHFKPADEHRDGDVE
jgi:putative SOS response-associated peptidase YedK